VAAAGAVGEADAAVARTELLGLVAAEFSANVPAAGK